MLFGLCVVQKGYLRIVNENAGVLHYALISTVPPVKLAFAFKHLFPPTVKHTQYYGFNPLAVNFKNIIRSIAVRGKRIGNKELQAIFYNNLHTVTGNAITVIGNRKYVF